MRADAVLICAPAVDFHTFLGISHEMLGRSLSAAVDSRVGEATIAERYLSCLSALIDARAELTPSVMGHLSYSALIAIDDCDLLGILQAAAGMTWTTQESTVHGVMVVVLSGTLVQWRNAIFVGTNAEGVSRYLYSKIMGLFEQAGVHVWQDFVKRSTNDRLFRLEHKRA